MTHESVCGFCNARRVGETLALHGIAAKKCHVNRNEYMTSLIYKFFDLVGSFETNSEGNETRLVRVE